MKTKQFIFAVMMVGALASPAFAQEAASGAPSFGVGAEAGLLGGPASAAMSYDMGQLRINGIFGFSSGLNGIGQRQNGTVLALGGRALWIVHQGSNADLSLGGGLGLTNVNPDGAGNSTTDIHVEALAQIRVFITTNVALSTALGFGIDLNDNRDDFFQFGGQFLPSVGLMYYFR
jgi:hypothetical protein